MFLLTPFNGPFLTFPDTFAPLFASAASPPKTFFEVIALGILDILQTQI